MSASAFLQEVLTGSEKNLFLIPRSDYQVTFPNIVYTLFSKQVLRILKLIR